MTMIQAAVIGIAAVVLAVQLKTLRGEFSVYLILAAALIIGFLGISRLELIVEMAEYFHVSLDYLLLGETESNSKAKRDILAVIESLTRIAREL